MDREKARDILHTISHPLRFRILEAMGEETITSSELARVIDEKEGKVLYHLRAMAELGVVEQDHLDGYQRRWSFTRNPFAATIEVKGMGILLDVQV